jgi:glycosyltransferase involved in cell wall biosynthesis
MKIYIINHYAGTPNHGMVFRPYYLAKEWVNQGHEVTIICASFSHLRRQNPCFKEAYEIEWIDGIRYIWLQTPAYEGNGIGRIINIASFILRLTLYLNKFCGESNPDVIISSSTYHLDIFITYILARRYNANFIFEVRDLWPLVPIELGKYHPLHPFILIISLAEIFGYKKADRVVSAIPYAYDYMKKRGLDLHRYAYIPNGVFNKAENCSLDKEVKDKLESIKKRGRSIIGYIGSFRQAYSLESLLLAAKELENSGADFVFVGQGDDKKRLERIIKEKNINNVHIFNPIRKDMIPALLDWFDICYTGFKKLSCFSYGVSSNKVYDYMLAAKPIVLAVDSPYISLVDHAACGITVPAEDTKALTDALTTFLASDEKWLKEVGQRGKEYVLKNHDYKKLSRDYIELIKNIQSNRS